MKESEVVSGELWTLQDPEEALEAWLRTEVVATYDELRADPSQAISSDEIRVHLAQLHARRSAEGGA